MQFPAEAHDTRWTLTYRAMPAPAGNDASTPVAHVPDVSVNNSPWSWTVELSKLSL